MVKFQEYPDVYPFDVNAWKKAIPKLLNMTSNFKMSVTMDDKTSTKATTTAATTTTTEATTTTTTAETTRLPPPASTPTRTPTRTPTTTKIPATTIITTSSKPFATGILEILADTTKHQQQSEKTMTETTPSTTKTSSITTRSTATETKETRSTATTKEIPQSPTSITPTSVEPKKANESNGDVTTPVVILVLLMILALVITFLFMYRWKNCRSFNVPEVPIEPTYVSKKDEIPGIGENGTETSDSSTGKSIVKTSDSSTEHGDSIRIEESSKNAQTNRFTLQFDTANRNSAKIVKITVT